MGPEARTILSRLPRVVGLFFTFSTIQNYRHPGETRSVLPCLRGRRRSVAKVSSGEVWSVDPNLVGGYQKVFSFAGVFPLSNGSDEGVLLVPLNPGVYTAVFKAGSAGTILCETYILPF